MLQDRGVERRHAGQEGRLLGREVGHDHVDVGPWIEDQLIAVAHRSQHDSRQRVDVEQRQDAHDLFRPRGGVGHGPGLALAHRRHDAAVRQHGGLGQAGGAAGVLQHRNLVPRVLVRGIGRVLAVVGHQVLERHVPVVAWPSRQLLLLGDRIEPVLGPRQIVGDRAHDQLLEPRLAAHGGHLRIERRDIQGDQDVGFRIADLVLEFTRRIERAVIHHHAAGLEHAEEGDDVVGRVGQVEAHLHARLHAKFLESGGSLVGRQLVIPEGHHLVEEIGEGPVAVLGAAVLEGLVDGLLRNIELPLHARRVALLPRIVRHCCGPPCADYVRPGAGGSSWRLRERVGRNTRRHRPCGNPGRHRAAAPRRWWRRPAGRQSARPVSKPRHRDSR